ncbi:cytochrome P450 [Litoreibacter janthinus]|uniref:Type I secretion C-terminal target domain (VC_A0849 subclass) n=1 Tax=Litoreibacter janthinus TaxID=670154 RepID=A0A1I6FPG5_9RHOB|nr:cytochrome P450 [Litoreibacter janthinus]SFR31788.1 type I secretion C-terminal target domain (VC_A0849 subclass) [Litoreibacter janthinus]
MKDFVTAYPPRVKLVSEKWGILQSLRAAQRNLIEIIPEIALHQPIVTGKMGKPWHMVMDPDAIRRILRDRLEDYPKSDVTKNILRPAIGDSLFVAEGAHWRWQRRAAAPVFSHRNVANLAPIMSAAAERSCARIEAQVGRAADLYSEMVTSTFEVISDVTFSDDEGFDRDAIHKAINGYIDSTAKVSLFDVLGFPTWIPRPGRVLSSGGTKAMKSMADDVITNRKAKKEGDVLDLLDLLMAGEDPETKRKMNTSELRDNLLTFIVAGHETTALTLAWALYLCAFDQDVQDRARDEAQSALHGRTATEADLASLPYIRQIIDETLRLYPPAAFLSRTAQVQDELCGRPIAPGDTVMLPVYALHRSRLLWDDPDAFDPDRFAKGKNIDRFAYLPFGDGPRICIGMSFAIQEAVIILATILSRFKFTRVEGKDPYPVLILTLRPEGGVWLNVESA